MILNIPEALMRFGEDTALYKEILDMFIDEPQFFFSKTLSLIHEDKLIEAASNVHRLKGTAGTIGAEQLYDICSILESILRGKKNGDPEKILQKLHEIYTESKIVIDEKRKLF